MRPRIGSMNAQRSATCGRDSKQLLRANRISEIGGSLSSQGNVRTADPRESLSTMTAAPSRGPSCGTDSLERGSGALPAPKAGEVDMQDFVAVQHSIGPV